MIKSSIHNWLREKIVGKEKIELLEELDKEGVELLKKLKVLYLPVYNINEHKTYWRYEPLITFVNLYADMIIRNYDKLKKDYENGKIKDGVTDTFEVYTFKTFIKKYSENNNDKEENELTKEEKETVKKELEKVLKTITSK